MLANYKDITAENFNNYSKQQMIDLKDEISSKVKTHFTTLSRDCKVSEKPDPSRYP